MLQMRKTPLYLFSTRNKQQQRKTSSKRPSVIQDERKMLPNESNKPIVTASGGVTIFFHLTALAHERVKLRN